MADSKSLDWGALGKPSTLDWGKLNLRYDVQEPVEPVPEAPPEKYGSSDFFGDTGSIVAKGFIGAGEAAVGAIDWLLPGQQGKAFEQLGWRPQEAKEFASSWESNELRQSRKNVDDAKGFLGTLDALGDNPAALAAMVGESIPSIVGGGGLGKLAYKGASAAGAAISGRVAAAIGEGTFGLGAAAESNRQADPNRELTDKGFLAAAGSGVGTGLFGFVGGKLASKMGVGDIDTLMASGMTQATTKGFAKQLVGGGISEGVFEELPQSMQETMWSNFASGKDIFDGVDKAAAQGLAAGFVMGAAGGGYNRVRGGTPYENQNQLDLHRAQVAGAAEAFTAAYETYQQNPSEANQEALGSAQVAYLAATKTRPALEEAADEAARKNAAAVVTAPSVDDAIEAFNRLTETSSILRTGVEAANILEQNTKKRAELAAEAAEAAAAAAKAAATDPNTPAPEPVLQQNSGEIEEPTLVPPFELTPPPAPAPVATVTPAPAPVVEPTPAPAPTALPKDLAGASPRYNLGTVSHSLNFESDIDKAAYIAAQKNPSKRDADYVAFVSAATGMSEPEVRAHGVKVRAAIKPLAGAGGKLTVPTVWNAKVAAVQQAKAGAFDKIKSLSDKPGVTPLLPASVRKLLSHDYTGSASPIITVARDLNYPKFDEVPTILKSKGVTPEEWAQFRAEIKEKVAPVRTVGVAEQVNKGATAGTMLDYLTKNADPRIAGMAKALKRFGKSNPYLGIKYGKLRKNKEGRRGQIKTFLESGEITGIQNTQGWADEITTLHEITHVLTYSWLNKAPANDPLRIELTNMREAAIAHWGKTKDALETEPYGFTDNGEFLAEAMANQEFQDFLRTVPATKDQSLWDKFVSWVKDVIGDPDLDLNMLGQALASIEKIAKGSTAVAKDVEKNKITGGGGKSTTTADTISDIASRDPIENYVDRVFAHPDPTMIDKLIDANEEVGKLDRAGVEAARGGPASVRRSVAELYAARMDAGYDDAFDVINDKIEALEQDDIESSMNEALGIEPDYDSVPEYEPDMGGEGMDEQAGLGLTVSPEEQALNEAMDQLWVGGGNNVAIIQRTMGQSETELRLVARAAGNGARSAMAAAMLRYPDISEARVHAEQRFTDLLNGDIVSAAETDRMAKQSDPEPATAEGGRKVIFDFKQRLSNAYRTGALKKLAAFWQNVMSLDGQIALKTDAQSILKGENSTDADYAKLVEAYNDELFEKAKAWSKERGHPEPDDKPSNRIIGFLKTGKSDMGKPIIMVTISGRGREYRGENPFLPSTAVRGNAYLDFNPSSKKNEIHAMELAGFEGSADVAYRVLSDVAKAHKLSLPTSDTLMTNNNVRRPWQTVAASLRLNDPNVLSPMNPGGDTSAYGMDPDLWRHLSDQERIGANILRHTHNALVSRPSNAARYAKIVVSNGRAMDNLSPSKDGEGFVATHEPNTSNGVVKGTTLNMRDFTQKLKTVEAIGGSSQSDPAADRKGMGATSMAFAIMSQSVLDAIENDAYAEAPATVTKAASKLGKQQGGWFFDQTPEQKTQLQEEIEAVRAVLTNPNSTVEDQQAARDVLRMLTADDIDLKIAGLIEEIGQPQTSNGRRGEINREIASLRLEQRAKHSTMLENIGVTPEAEYDAGQAIEADKELGTPGIRIKGEHYSHQPRTELDPTKYGTGYKGAERTRVMESNDPRLQNRTYFYADAGEGVRPESGVGAVKHLAYLDNIYPAHEAQTIQQTIPNSLTGDAYMNAFESAVLDAGYRGYSNNFGHQLGVVVFGRDPIPVMTEAAMKAEGAGKVERQVDGTLNNLPSYTIDGKRVQPTNWEPATKIAEQYMASRGMPYSPPANYVKVNPERATRIATAYANMIHDPQSPEVKAAFAALAEETIAQYEAVMASGLKVDFMDMAKGDPYAKSPRLVIDDVRNNNHMSIFSTIDGYGTDGEASVESNPMLAPTKFKISGRTALVNDLFRVVHDYFGHVKEGVGFRADGEENAWRAHSAMFSPAAQRALTTETRGQNSWVNYGPYGERNRSASGADTHYAPQKTGLLPMWVSEEGRYDEPGQLTEVTTQDAVEADVVTADEPMSPATELKIMEQPVSPAYPNEVRMLPRSAEGWFEKRTEKVRVKFQEQHATLARVIKNLGIKAEDIAMDVMGAVIRSKGLIQSNLENLVKDPLNKIENNLFNAGVKDHKEKLEAYLKYRHVPEANAQAAKINPFNARTGAGFNLTNLPGSGITTEEAVAKLAQMNKSKDGQALRDAAAEFDKMIKGLQNYAVERGLESADTIGAWRNVFPNYAPFYRELDLGDTFSTGAQGFSTRSGVSRRFMGSEAEIQPILASTRMLGQRIVNRGETARVAQALLRLAKNNTPMFKGKDGKWHPMWKIDTFPNVRTVKVVNVYRFKDINGNYVKNGAGVPIEFYSQNAADAYLETNTNAEGGPKQIESLGPHERVVIAQNPDYISRDNVVIVPVNGDNVAVVFDDESEDAVEMYRNLKNMDTLHLDAAFTLPSMVSRWVVATATGYNPIFSLFNFMRDVQATAVNMNAENIPGWDSVSDTAAVVGASVKNAGSLIMYLQAKQNKLHSNKKIDITPAPGTPAWWMEKAKASGGLTGIMDSLVGMTESEAQVRELFGVERKAKTNTDPAIENVDKLDRGRERFMGAVEWLEGAVEGEGKDIYAKAIGRLTTGIANLNQGAELATRTAAFKAAYEKFIAAGKTDAEASTLAANISKGISVNFNRKGQWSGRAGAFFPFFNAAAQGSTRFFESVFEKVSVKAFDADGKPVMHQTTKLTPFGLKLALSLPALGMLQALLLAGYEDDEISEADKDRNFIIPMPDGGFAKIPLPLGLNVPFNMGREMADMVVHPENFIRHATNLIMQPLTGFNPLGGAGNHIQTLTPAILDPIVGLLQNRDAFNRPIAKEDFDKSKPTPGFTRAKEGASWIGKLAAEGINYGSGGGKYGIGTFSPTPDQVDYMLGQIGGGVGREAMKLVGLGGATIDIATSTPREELPWYKVPLVGKLYGNVNEASNLKAQLYDAKTKVAELKYEHAQMLKAGEREAASAFLKEHPEIKLAPRIDAVLKEEAELRKMRLAAREKDDPAAAQKANEKIEAKLIKLRDEIRKIRGD